jgi:hypothetical protein
LGLKDESVESEEGAGRRSVRKFGLKWWQSDKYLLHIPTAAQ